jgi:hypothetical protein
MFITYRFFTLRAYPSDPATKRPPLAIARMMSGRYPSSAICRARERTAVP